MVVGVVSGGRLCGEGLVIYAGLGVESSSAALSLSASDAPASAGGRACLERGGGGQVLVLVSERGLGPS